jgi:hypothetical protein
VTGTSEQLNERQNQYFREAALLRWCLWLNEHDFRFSEQGGRIIYLMDANIVRFFANPELETTHVTPFQLHGSRDPGYAAGTALITAEFLFSRGLAGQRNSPAFLAPAHGEEIASIVNAMRRQALQTKDEEHNLEVNKEAVAEILKQFASGALDRHSTAAALQKKVPELAKLVLADHFQSALQLSRLYDDDLLRPLALHTKATLDILEPAPKEVEAWFQRINDQKKKTKVRHEKEKRRHDDDRVRRDAEVLLQVILLDQRAAEEDAAGSSTRYVLITADHAVVDAYAKWYWSDKRPPEARFVVRMPLQYVPILNSYEMPNDIKTTEISERAGKVLDSLFESLRKSDPKFTERLLWYRMLARDPDEALADNLTAMFGENPLTIDVPMLEKVRALWHEVFGSGVVLNSRLMNRRRNDFEFLEKLLRDDVDLRQEIYALQERSLARIEVAHTVYATRLNLSALRAGHGLAAAQRAYPAIRKTFDTLGGMSAIDVLAGIAGGDLKLLDDVDVVLGRENSEAYFIAACIAHRCGQWSAAAIYSHRALELMPEEKGADDPQGEVSFLYASAIRYSLADTPIGGDTRVDEVSQALAILSAAEKSCEANGDLFGQARALSERCALRVMRLYYRWLSNLPSPESELTELSDFDAQYKAVTRMLEQPLDVPDLVEPLRRLKRQHYGNIISLWVYCQLLAPQSPEARMLAAIDWPPPQEAVSTYKSLGDNHISLLVMRAECEMAMFAQGDQTAQSTLATLRDLGAKANEDPAILNMDRAEIRRFIEMMAARSKSDSI